MKKTILSFIIIILTTLSYSQNLEILNNLNKLRVDNGKNELFSDDVLCNISKDYASYVLSYYNHIPERNMEKKINNIFFDTEYEYRKMLFVRGLYEEEIYNFGFFIGSFDEKQKDEKEWVEYFNNKLLNNYFLEYISGCDLKIAGISVASQKSLGKYTQVCIILVTVQ
jgi:hypothetical protein